MTGWYATIVFFSRDIPTIYATQDAVRKKKIVFDFRSFVATMLLAINAGVVGEGADPSADLVADDGDADDDTDDVAAVDVLMALLMVLMLLAVREFVVVIIIHFSCEFCCFFCWSAHTNRQHEFPMAGVCLKERNVGSASVLRECCNKNCC